MWGTISIVWGGCGSDADREKVLARGMLRSMQISGPVEEVPPCNLTGVPDDFAGI